MSTDGTDGRLPAPQPTEQPQPQPGTQPTEQPQPGTQPTEQPQPQPGPQPQHPSAPQPSVKKGFGTGAIIAIAAGVGVVLVAIIVLVVMLTRSAGTPSTGDAGGESATPAGVVEAYLEALAASDAETALSYIDEAPTDSPFLTDKALAASNELGPITDIEVTEPVDVEISARVVATYSLGDVPVTTEFSVHDYSREGVWKMVGGTAELDFGGRFTGLDMTLNGIPVEPGTIEVFPGTYQVATTTPNFVVGGESIVTVREPFDYPSLSEMNATLSEEGVLIFRQTVKDAVAACLSSKTLVAGCGLDLPELLSDDTRLIDGTITRSLAAEAQATLENLQPQEAFSDPLVVSGDYIGGVSVTADMQQNGESGSGEVLFAPSLGAPVVDFTSGTPVVRWD